MARPNRAASSRSAANGPDAGGIVRIVSARALRLLIGAALLLVLGTTSASAAPLAANKIVTIQNFTFNPATITVNVGDTITWTNADPAFHSARATGGSFDTGTLAQGQGKTITFSVPGTFGYICGIHGASMSGTVVVLAAATPVPTPQPTVAPTAQQTLRPTPQPTVLPSEPATSAPTLPPTPSPTVATTVPATPSPTPVATQIAAPSASSVSVVATNAPAPTAAVAQDTASANGTLLIAGGAAIILGLVGVAFVLLRR